jgi:hypothetical protein
MKIKLNYALSAFVIAFTYVIFIASYAASSVIKEGGKIYIVDRTSERWDITQAVSIGYDPNQFEFGIGRDAFQTLDERHWVTKPGNTNPTMRVIGVAENGDVHAYSVGKLRHHETANTTLGSHAIVAGY